MQFTTGLKGSLLPGARVPIGKQSRTKNDQHIPDSATEFGAFVRHYVHQGSQDAVR